MKIHHIRNATLLIESKDKFILADPMLGKKGTAGPPFTLFRHKPRRNPTLDLPKNAMEIIDKTTHCLITHLHPDHLDKAAVKFLKEKEIPVICSKLDEKQLLKRGLNVTQNVNYWEQSEFLGGTIEGIPAKHGYGFIAGPMGNVMGFHIQLPGQKSIYISSDTIYTGAVDKVLKEYHPDISVLAAGSAQLDLFKPLLMTMEDILKFVKNTSGTVIANHLEAINHCPTTRAGLRDELENAGLSEKVAIPEDGEVIEVI